MSKPYTSTVDGKVIASIDGYHPVNSLGDLPVGATLIAVADEGSVTWWVTLLPGTHDEHRARLTQWYKDNGETWLLPLQTRMATLDLFRQDV